jgi:hypothetical protein
MRFYLSSRPDDARGYEGRLREEIGRQRPGDSFCPDLEDADTLMLLIGPQWVRESSTAASRLMNDRDPVRIELEEALRCGLRVVPVLIRGAKFPGASDLPPQLHPLLPISAWPISHHGFRDDVKSLLAGLTRPSRGAREASARIEISTPKGVLAWFLEKEYTPARLLIDGEDRAALRMLNQSKAFDVDPGAHTVTLRSTDRPIKERSLQFNLSPGETARLQASRSGWLGLLSLERLG